MDSSSLYSSNLSLGYNFCTEPLNSIIEQPDVYDSNNNFPSLKETVLLQNNYAALYPKLKNLKKRYEFFEKTNKKIKDELKNFNILHKNKEGINVIAGFLNDGEKNRIISYCEKNKYEFVVCPKPIRVNENAISIEVKRLE